MLKTIIIDDELPVRQMLTTLATEYCEGISIVGTAASVEEGLNEIFFKSPDLILLDINLPDGTGFDILSRLGDHSPMVIFITAYNEHAIKAFKFSAVDYILKPVNIDELQKAVEKCVSRKEREDLSSKLKVLIQNFPGQGSESKKIILRTSDCIHIVKVNEIIFCRADQNYTVFFLTDTRKLLVSKTLKEFEELLAEYGFFRPHQSYLININFISRYEKSDGGELILTDGSHIPVSKRKRDELLQLLNQL